jgi:hypothetical protein
MRLNAMAADPRKAVATAKGVPRILPRIHPGSRNTATAGARSPRRANWRAVEMGANRTLREIWNVHVWVGNANPA